jgi:hypothetical protein
MLLTNLGCFPFVRKHVTQFSAWAVEKKVSSKLLLISANELRVPICGRKKKRLLIARITRQMSHS